MPAAMRILAKGDESEKYPNVGVWNIVNAGVEREQFFKMLDIHRHVLFDSRIGDSLVVDSKTSQLNKIEFNSKSFKVDTDRKFLYAQKNGNTLIWGEKSVSSEKRMLGSAKVILEWVQKVQIDLNELDGLATIAYKGIINGEEAFRIKGGEITPISPKLIVERRIDYPGDSFEVLVRE